jgi:hypothetical protein
LGNDHVTTVAATSIQIATTRGVFLNGCDYFEKIAADGHEIIFKAKFADTRIYVTAVDAQNASQIIDDRLKFMGNQAYLS